MPIKKILIAGNELNKFLNAPTGHYINKTIIITIVSICIGSTLNNLVRHSYIYVYV